MNGRRHLDERPPLPGSGYLEDYTVPFLWSAGALIFIGLFALWAIWGLPLILVLALLAHRLLPRR
jgi:hypothetical protein